MKASRPRPVSRVGGLSRMSGRPPRYALTCRYWRPGKPSAQSEVGRSPAKRDLTIVTSLSDALNIWLASKRTTLSVCTVCMAARTGAAFAQSAVLSPQSCFPAWLRARSPLLSCQAHFFFEQGII
jgi:hypothetical protein